MPDRLDAMPDAFDRDGFAILPQLVDTALLGTTFDARHAGAGLRHLIDHPAVGAVLASAGLRQVLGRLFSSRVFAYKATVFDKHAEANWLVAWHRDLSIPVNRRIEIPGWRAWSVKEGIHYVQPPPEVQRRLLAIRINIDPCGADNGPLRVAPGTHRHLDSADATCVAERVAPIVCSGAAGDAVAMRPLLLHASAKAAAPTRRRVLHLEFADFDLPGGIDWASRRGV